ncbi:hypothetical protein GE09DRAFT_1231827 [Coniochaeta sp. 2T2.1]|nr:hypothetical protein GE09DRAFT_1231827 [Coniochaeta sp. 2T2.1]
MRDCLPLGASISLPARPPESVRGTCIALTPPRDAADATQRLGEAVAEEYPIRHTPLEIKEEAWVGDRALAATVDAEDGADSQDEPSTPGTDEVETPLSDVTPGLKWEEEDKARQRDVRPSAGLRKKRKRSPDADVEGPTSKRACTAPTSPSDGTPGPRDHRSEAAPNDQLKNVNTIRVPSLKRRLSSASDADLDEPVAKKHCATITPPSDASRYPNDIASEATPTQDNEAVPIPGPALKPKRPLDVDGNDIELGSHKAAGSEVEHRQQQSSSTGRMPPVPDCSKSLRPCASPAAVSKLSAAVTPIGVATSDRTSRQQQAQGGT